MSREYPGQPSTPLPSLYPFIMTYSTLLASVPTRYMDPPWSLHNSENDIETGIYTGLHHIHEIQRQYCPQKGRLGKHSFNIPVVIPNNHPICARL